MTYDPIGRFRRFARAVTKEVGALDTSFLGRGRPLGAARVINAIGSGITDVAAIRDYLGLDSGLMSRLLRSLEDEGLVLTVTSKDDGRRRVASLTDAGTREFQAYEELSNARASALLSQYSKTDDLLSAMDMIASALDRERITISKIDPRSDAAVYCLGEYYAELGRRFKTGFDVSLSRNPDVLDMIAPRGAFIIALSDNMPVGCVGLKGSGGDIAEIKRLWVSQSARGLGIAKRLMHAAEETARELSIKTLRLDTNSALPEAVKLYCTSGWVEIDRFNDDPYPDRFFEKHM